MGAFADGICGYRREYAHNCTLTAWNGADYQDSGSKVVNAVGALVGKNQATISYVYSYDNAVNSTAKGGYTWTGVHYVRNYASGLVGENVKGGVIEYAVIYGCQVTAENKKYSGSPNSKKYIGVICAENDGTCKHFCTLSDDPLSGSVIAHSDGTYEFHTACTSIAEFLNVLGFKGIFIIGEDEEISFGQIKK